MSDNQENGGTGRKPDFIAYNVQEGKDGKGYFHRIGAAWEHRDREGVDINLESVPVNGRISLRALKEDRMRAYDDEHSQNAAEAPDSQRGPSRGRSR